MKINKKKYVIKLRTLIADLPTDDKIGLLLFTLAAVVRNECSFCSRVSVIRTLAGALDDHDHSDESEDCNDLEGPDSPSEVS